MGIEFDSMFHDSFTQHWLSFEIPVASGAGGTDGMAIKLSLFQRRGTAEAVRDLGADAASGFIELAGNGFSGWFERELHGVIPSQFAHKEGKTIEFGVPEWVVGDFDRCFVKPSLVVHRIKGFVVCLLSLMCFFPC